jgi:small conductance mechanosensitive channel
MLRRRKIPRPSSYFESRTEQWRQVGLGGEIDRAKAQRARGGVIVLLALIAGVLILFSHRQELFPGLNTQVRIATVAALVVLGSGLARYLGRGLAPQLFRRMDPGTAGIVGFLIRLFTIMLMLVVALRIAGLKADTLLAGGAFTAIIVGLAAQQTLSNLFAGLVLISTRPFRMGERVRFQGGPLAGQMEGIVGNLGLFYTTLVDGADRILVPNNTILQIGVTPLREPDRVELRARFDADTTPTEVQRILEGSLSVPTRYPPQISLEELDRDDVVVRIVATPQNPGDGGRLASEILAAVREDDRDGQDAEANARGD